MKNAIMTLQNLCIEVIVKEFEQFFFIFCNTDDGHLKRKFEFLQRVYSYDIAFKLNALDMMKPKYIDLLVNKYLKELNTSWLKDVPWETVAAKFAEIGSNIQKITFRKCSTEIPWKNIIPHLTNLEVMDFKYYCNNEILKCVAQFCRNIVEIYVSESRSVTSEGIKYLCVKENGQAVCPKIKTLSFAECNVKFEGIKYLIKNMRSLEMCDDYCLAESLYSLHQSDLLALDTVKPYNLTKLVLLSYLASMPHYTDVLKICFTLCPHLKSLTYTISNEEHLNLISGSSELEVLHIACNWNSEVDITNFVKFNGRKLTELWLRNCIFSLNILSESCPRLKELNLDQVISKVDGDILSVFHHLKTCGFEKNARDPQRTPVETVCLVLEYSPKLEEIHFTRYDFSSTDLKNAVLQCCKKCPIRKVLFSGPKVDINFAKDILTNCRTLEQFTLECNLVREDEEELHRFAQALPNCPNLYGRKITFEDVYMI